MTASGFVSTQKKTLLAALLLLIIRSAAVIAMGIMPQDAYYYFYGENLALSYFDHPPMIGWILRLFTELFGRNIYAVHLADFFITACTTAVFYLLAKRFYKQEEATSALLLFFSTIMVSILSIISTPDVPLLLFWCLSVLFAHRAITQDFLKDWIFTGVFMGAAFLSKYTAVFLPAGLFLFLLVTPQHRSKIFNYRFIIVVFFFVLVLSPVVIWNVQNDFISFKFQGGNRMSQISFANIQPTNFFGTLGHQLFVLLPVLFCALVYFLWKQFWQQRKQIRQIPVNSTFLLCFFLPLFLFFFSISFLYWVKINWMMPAYITAIIWVVQYTNRKWLKWQYIVSVCLHVLALLFILFYPVPVKSDDTWWGWNKLNTQTEALMQQKPGYFLFAHDDYKTTAVLHFISGRKVYSGNIIGKPALQFMIVDKNAPQQLKGRDAIFLDSEPRFSDEAKSTSLPEGLEAHFESVTELEPILIRNKNGKALRKFFVYECKNYKP
jgi:4-amino-4-deoxy-L-arabinose transferase-like glycosyltransferase